MNPLQKQLKFKTNSVITQKELTDLADELLKNTWEINFIGRSQEINLYNKGWRFQFHNKKRALGTCSPRKRVIYLSSFFFQTNPDKSKEWENTIRHEIAHALDYETRGTSDHSKRWRRMAVAVLATPTATTCNFTSGISKFLKVCPKCGNTQSAHQNRTPKDACAKCCNKYNSGRFSYDFVFKIEINPEFGRTIKPSNKEKLIIQPNPVNGSPIIATGIKKCKCCGQEKSTSDFYKLKTSKDGLHSVCKVCYNDKKKKAKLNN